MTTRTLGKSGIEVSALGIGCWAIGGVFRGTDGSSWGWGPVDDNESIRALRRGFDLGISFIDTADVYGAGHSEKVIGKAIAGMRDQVVIATKWSNCFDEQSQIADGQDFSVEYVRTALEGSLRRLGTDYIDLFQLHHGALEIERALPLIEPLEELVAEGKIRAYGWSTDDPDRVRAFATAAGDNCVAIQHDFSVFNHSPAVLPVVEELGMASINRGPLAMGVLTGSYTASTQVSPDDFRSSNPEWMVLFKDGKPTPEYLSRLDAVREILTAGGRSLAQGALGFLWGSSHATIPIPGVRTVAQIEDNAGALAHGPLSESQVIEVVRLINN